MFIKKDVKCTLREEITINLFRFFSISDWISLFGTISSVVLSTISVIIALLTLKQSNKTIEGATRPYITVSCESASSRTHSIYLIIRNHGASGGTITSFNYSPRSINSTTNQYLDRLNGIFLAPNQKIFIPARTQHFSSENVYFSFEYTNSIKTYREEINLNILLTDISLNCSEDDNTARVLKDIKNRLL